MKRPNEVSTASIAIILGAVESIFAWTKGGIDLTKISDLAGPITVLVGFVPAIVTWFVAAKQRAGELISAKDGTVQS